jgi:hemolysin activation/secretion protein
MRVGDRQWEEIELLLNAWRVPQPAPLLAQLETLTAQLVERERARAAEQEQRAAEDKQTGAQQSKSAERDKKKQPPAPPDEDLRAGPFAVKNFSALLSAATVETRLAMTFRLGRDSRGQWRVTEARLGDNVWADADALVRALDAEKAARARADMSALAAALEAFRRERGFYVVAETSVALVDQLTPRYLPAVIRLDPWHRPYDYAGTPARYTLRSLGPDGRPGTPDDVLPGGGAH